MKLHTLENDTRPFKRRKRVGRGMGSGFGKTCARGHKGAGSRSGWKSRARYEGGQLPLYRKLPARGFSNARFQAKLDCINLSQIDELFSDGEIVNVTTLKSHGYMKGVTNGLKILGDGEIKKNVRIEATAFSKSAIEKLEKANISYTII